MSIVRRLRLRDLRCYETADAAIGDRLTIVHGANGAGKTTLLEALYLGCTGSSCRTRNEREVVRFGAPAARVELDLERHDGPHRLAVGYEPGQPKRLTADGAPVERLLDVPFRPLVSVFLPDRLELVKGPPALRRSHVDQLVAGLWPARRARRRAYSQALAQRNALLARVRSRATGRDALATWDLELGRHAVALRADRIDAIARIAKGTELVGGELGLAGRLELRLRSRSDATDAESFACELAARLDTDLERGFTTHGPHRDELDLLRDGRALRTYGSQGEQRLGLLALLLAEREALEAERDHAPLLLLDDVLSELDGARRELLLEHAGRAGQVVLTTTEPERLPDAALAAASVLQVAGGTVRELVSA
ncbi:MAG: DNA replication and repair protein RecF [Solirubrobacteraceae bacterium]|nr:DNA replication and repair protein RecF [Solirubrobacteraceae bacterium]